MTCILQKSSKKKKKIEILLTQKMSNTIVQTTCQFGDNNSQQCPNVDFDYVYLNSYNKCSTRRGVLTPM
jgi:hypothetical protein